ncbi:MAG: hypothetical protein HFJ30_00220 [Clostridia bacterium]|jgi:hypothetical protein|nr:hypothetical protein [Clostridia bacterium]
MSISIDLEKVNYNEFVNKLMENEKINDRELLEKIILEFGNKIGEDLVVLHNEYYEDGTCSWNMCNMIEEVFELNSDEYSQDYVYDVYSELSSYLTSYKEIDEAYENLGIERKISNE